MILPTKADFEVDVAIYFRIPIGAHKMIDYRNRMFHLLLFVKLSIPIYVYEVVGFCYFEIQFQNCTIGKLSFVQTLRMYKLQNEEFLDFRQKPSHTRKCLIGKINAAVLMTFNCCYKLQTNLIWYLQIKTLS